MDNKEYVGYILQADQALKTLLKRMFDQLSQEDVEYRIEFSDGAVYDFYQAFSVEDRDEMNQERLVVIKRLLLDALERLTDPDHIDVVSKETTLTVEDMWGSVASLQVFKPKNEREDVVKGVAEVIEVQEKSKPLNVDSRYVKAQKIDISFEDYTNLMSFDEKKDSE